MNRRFTHFETNSQLLEILKTRKYGVLLTRLQNHKAMDMERVGDPNLWKLFRFIKTCFFGCFTTFALNKHSPYTIIFDTHMRKYL